jgi:hypothetical protein
MFYIENEQWVKTDGALTCIADGGEPVSNGKHSAPSHDALQSLLHQMLALCI